MGKNYILATSYLRLVIMHGLLLSKKVLGSGPLDPKKYQSSHFPNTSMVFGSEFYLGIWIFGSINTYGGIWCLGGTKSALPLYNPEFQVDWTKWSPK